MADKPNTITITNFTGRLTRVLNGDLNSGFAKFRNSWGYDPFTKPMNLTWFEQPSSILSNTSDLILAAKPRFTSDQTKIYGISSGAKLYEFTPNSITSPNLDTSSVLATLTSNSPSLNFGASMEFFGATEKIYIGNDAQINSVNFDGSGDATVGSASNYKSNSFRPLKEYIGKLIFGNGNTIGAISATGTVTSSVIGTGLGNLYSELNPPLPVESRVADIDVSPDYNYLYITASQIPNENIMTFGSDRQSASASDGAVYKWNGVDEGVTAATTIPSYAVTALQTYLAHNLFFSNDSFGSSLNDGGSKLLNLPHNKSPFPNATLVNGNFVSWIAPESDMDANQVYGSMYYFGSLDQENPSGLWRVMRHTATIANGFVYQTPLNLMVGNAYQTLNNSVSSVVSLGYGKHYFSVFEKSASTSQYKLFRFLVTSTGTGIPQSGVYETQTQLFAKRIDLKQIRVYTEPTAMGNGFQLDLIGADGEILDNGTFTYSFTAGSDDTLLQGALERINFNPTSSPGFALGIRVTNTGTTNMVIKKIEVDWDYSGK